MVLNMKVLSVLLFLLVVCEFTHCDVLETSNLKKMQRKPFYLRSNLKRIFGGTPATISEFPHHLGLMENGLYICGATVVSLSFAISAAHCLDSGTPASHITMWGGSSSRTSGGHIFGVENYMIHPNFGTNVLDFDVAILEAEEPFDNAIIVPASLPEPCFEECCDTCPSTIVRVAGWGFTENEIIPDELLQIKQSIMDSTECEHFWGEITSRQFCVAIEQGIDSCGGDSGGGIMLDSKLIGVVSYGAYECGNKVPSVYTRIENVEIREWIQQNTEL